MVDTSFIKKPRKGERAWHRVGEWKKEWKKVKSSFAHISYTEKEEVEKINHAYVEKSWNDIQH